MSDEQLAENTKSALAEWPTLAAAWGCVNCSAMFREPHSGHCPHCNSESVYDVAAALGRWEAPDERA